MYSINYLLAKTIQNDHLREADQLRLARLMARGKKTQDAKKAHR